MTHLHSEFQFKMSWYKRDNEQKLKMIGIFHSSRGLDSAGKIFDWNRIQTWPVYSQDTSIYQISIQNVNLWWNYDQKLKNYWIFLRPRDITLPNNIQLELNSNLICVFSWHILKKNVNFYRDNERKLNFSKPKRHNSNSNLTCVSLRHLIHISFENLHVGHR